MALTPGSRLGVYEITAAIGKGGMGEVFRARDTRLNRDVALKILPEEFVNSPDRAARFTREAQTLASLNHPNIAHLYGLEIPNAGSGQESPFLVMELVEGEDLSQRIARGAIPIDEALPIAKQITEALEAAHEQGIIHRDLKPANIKVRADGTVKVLDFGLAKAIEGAGEVGAAGRTGADNLTQSPTITSPAMTAAGMILGTAAYMSPEQAKGRPVDKRSDVWAFGCVLYEMLTGRRAFEGDDVSDTMASVLKSEPDWRALPATVPPAVQRLLRRALEKDRRKRLADIADARLELDDRGSDGLSVVATDMDPQIAVARPWRVNAWTWCAFAASLLAAAVFVFAGQRDPPVVPAPQAVRFSFSLPALDGVQSGAASGLSVSPSGEYVAVVRMGEPRQIAVRRLDGTELTLLKGSEDVLGTPFWSPDSRFIAFIADRKLKKVEMPSGAVQTIADVGSLMPIAGPGGFGASGTWNMDGEIVFATRTDPGSSASGVYGSQGLFQVSASGGTPKPLTIPDTSRSETEHGSPWFLPDGRTYLFRARSKDSVVSTIYVGVLGQRATTKIVEDASNAAYVSPGQLVFARRGVLLAQRFDASTLRLSGETLTLTDDIQAAVSGRASFGVSETGVLAVEPRSALRDSRLTWLDRTGKELGTIWDPGVFETIQLSRDDRRVAVGRASDEGVLNIWTLDLARGVQTKLTFGGVRESNPAWSADGSRLSFNSTRNAVKALYDMSSAGGGEAQLLAGPEPLSVDDRSRDDRYLLYHFDAGGGWALPLAGEDRTPVAVVRPSSGRLDQFNFSPDGKWVIYGSDESGRPQVYITPFPPNGERLQISSAGGVQPRWRGDSREAFYLSLDGVMMAVDVALGKTAEARAPRRLFQTQLAAPSFNSEQFAVTQDGQRFLMLAPASSRSAETTIRVTANWPSLFR